MNGTDAVAQVRDELQQDVRREDGPCNVAPGLDQNIGGAGQEPTDRGEAPASSPVAPRAIESEVVLDLPDPPVPPGVYFVKYDHHETVVMFKGQPKLFVYFRIVCGPFKGRIVVRHYNVKNCIGKPRRNGAFKPPLRGAFMHDYCRLFLTPAQRLDRISLDPFRRSIIVARVAGVQRNSWGREVPPQLWTTCVRELVEVYKHD